MASRTSIVIKRTIITSSCDIKMILDPIKNAYENIEYLLTNTNFNNNNSQNDIKDFQNIILLYSIINQNQN